MATIRKGAVCPLCEIGSLDKKNKDLTFKYEGRTKKINNQNVYSCNVCDYETQSAAGFNDTEKILADFRRTVDGLLETDRLTAIRIKLGCNKSQMAQLLSVNAKTIGRYENGKLKQSDQIDKLYRVLENYPEAMLLMNKDTCLDRYLDFLTIAEESYEYTKRKPRPYQFSADGYFIEVKEIVNG